MFRTRSRVLAAARLATVGEQVRSGKYPTLPPSKHISQLLTKDFSHTENEASEDWSSCTRPRTCMSTISRWGTETNVQTGGEKAI